MIVQNEKSEDEDDDNDDVVDDGDCNDDDGGNDDILKTGRSLRRSSVHQPGCGLEHLPRHSSPTHHCCSLHNNRYRSVLPMFII